MHFFIAATGFAGTYMLCMLMERRGSLLDVPKARSAHTGSLSRAGGLAIFAGLGLCFLLLAVWNGFSGQAVKELHLSLSFWGPVLGYFFLGVVDDFLDLGPLKKLCMQISIALLFAFLYLRSQDLANVPFQIFRALFFVCLLIGLINVCNFMDGVDGLCASCMLIVFLWISFEEASLAGMRFITALYAVACLAAFLWRNLRAGGIFLGDGGSYGVSALLIALSLPPQVELGSDPSGRALFLPLVFSPFIVDAGATLLWRLARKERAFEGHADHLYQKAFHKDFPPLHICVVYCSLTVLALLIAWSMNNATMKTYIIVTAMWYALLVVLWFGGHRFLYLRR